MIDQGEQLQTLAALAERCEITVRFERLDGEGGGLCQIKGQDTLFIDSSADIATQLDRSVRALAGHDALDRCYIRPDLRALLDAARDSETGGGSARHRF